MEVKELVQELKGDLIEAVKDDVVETVKVVTKAEVEKILQEIQMGKVQTVPNLSEGERKDIREFFKALLAKDLIALKALSEGTDSEGGYLVPDEFRAQVLDIAKDVGYLRKYGVVLPMTGDTLKIPKIASKPSVSWVAESGVIGTSEPSFGILTLTAKKAGVIVPVTQELFQDSKVPVDTLLAKLFAEAFAEAEDTQGFTGDGTVFTGVLNASGVNTVTMGAGDTAFTNVTADDLINLIAAVPSKVANKSMFVMHRTVFAYIKTLKDGSGNYLFSPADKTIWGYPVLTLDVMPSLSDSGANKPFIIFGDISYIYMGDKGQMSVAIADQAVVGGQSMFERFSLAIRAVERVAIGIAMDNAFAVLKTAAS